MSLELGRTHPCRVVRSGPESRLSAFSKRLWLKEGLEAACCEDEAATLALGEVAATRPADGGFDDTKI